MNSKPDLLTEWPDWFPLDKVEELESLAAIGYTHEKMALYFEVSPKSFIDEIDREDSRILYHINKGILENEADEAIATLASAKEGNATQAQRLDKKRYQLNFQQLKEEIIYGKE
jgi:hypothetical protein